MKLLNNNRGEITSRDLLITAIITLIIALIIVALIIALSGRKTKTGQDAQTQKLIEQIQQQAKDAAESGTETGQTDGQEDAFESEATYTGTLTEHVAGAHITVRTSRGAERILLSPETSITHNGTPMQESDLSVGDTLSVAVTREKDGTQTAAEITILRATSPNVPANVSEPTIQPDPIETREASPY